MIPITDKQELERAVTGLHMFIDHAIQVGNNLRLGKQPDGQFVCKVRIFGMWFNLISFTVSYHELADCGGDEDTKPTIN